MLVNFWFGIENCKQFAQCRSSRLHGVVQLRKLLHWVKQTRDQQCEGNDSAERDITAMYKPSANTDHECRCKDTREFNKRKVPRADAHTALVAIEQRAI